MKKGIEYKFDGDSRRTVMNGYSDTRRIGFNDLSKGAKSSDIAQLRKVQLQNFATEGEDVMSKMTIGMEIEKTRISRSAIKAYALIAGFERDGSCGYEAVTNICPLLPAGRWRNKVFNMMVEASRVIEDEYSPSNSSCGGHITLGHADYSGKELLELIRPYMGIVFSLFRKRMSNYYCKGDLLLKGEENGSRYKAVLVKGNVLEMRIPSRFQSVKQMMRRYELMYELIDFAVNKPNGTHTAFLKRIKPIIVSMYSGDVCKADEILELSKHMRKFILTERVNKHVQPHLEVAHRYDLDREVLQSLMNS